MSTFSVPVVKIKNISPIANADAIEVAEILGYRCVVKRNEFAVNQLVAYIPEDSIVPLWLQERLNLVGRLAGSNKNRVKAVSLKGVVSQGLVLPLDKTADGELTIAVPIAGTHIVKEGDNIASLLGITKYEPPIPTCMAGEVCNMRGHTLKFDIENIQRYPDVLVDGEEVVYTEKIHGTFCGLAYVIGVDHHELLNKNSFAFSKGLGENGLVFKNNDKNANNVYHRTLVKNYEKIKALALKINKSVYVLGEVFGAGIQDLTYGVKSPEFRAFDIFVGEPQTGRFLNYDEFVETCKDVFEVVPLLYRGPYSKETELTFRSGRDSVNGVNIREGIVIKPVTERTDSTIGRVILKSVSPEYLLRKGKATEFK